MARKNAKYTEYSRETQQFMLAVEKHLIDKFNVINNEWEGLLQMLATTYDLYINCKEKIKEEGLLITNRFNAIEKNPLLKVQIDAQIQCLKMVQEFGLTPKAMKGLNIQENNEDEFIEGLTK